MAVLERDRLWSLWALTDGRWSLLDSSADRNALDRQARSLQAVFATKIFMVVQGRSRLLHDDARAAIREVAAWLRQQNVGAGAAAANWLEQEAERG